MIKLAIPCLVILPLFMQAQDHGVSFTALPQGINTIDDEELGRWSLDGKSLIFTRLTKERVGLSIAQFDNAGKVISVEAFPFDATYKGGGHTLSPDGKHMVFTLCGKQGGMGGCVLYTSELVNGKWTTPKNMGTDVNSTTWESQPVFGLDGQTIYFASTRPGGAGGTDIWLVRQVSPENWSKPKNAGAGINTINNEGSPYLHFDGRTLYFMRDGSTGSGGYDLYFAKLANNDQWMKAENMGNTINSAADEGGLAIHPDGKTAIITRFTTDRQNDLFTFPLPEQFSSAPLQALNVVVKDKQTQKPVKARLEIYQVEAFDTTRLSQWADDQGKITTPVLRNKMYGVIAEAEGYLAYSANLPSESSAVRNLEINMIPLSSAKGQVIVMQNVFFETGSSALLAGSIPELNKLVLTLKNNMNMKIEITGYTDNVGTEPSNIILSEARAKKVNDYLVNGGIDPARLSYSGKGESQPIADNATAEGRRLNRRTEFKVISN
jgi:outer membrane protein OmpA-like peptidoglycan-associated protein